MCHNPAFYCFVLPLPGAPRVQLQLVMCLIQMPLTLATRCRSHDCGCSPARPMPPSLMMRPRWLPRCTVRQHMQGYAPPHARQTSLLKESMPIWTGRCRWQNMTRCGCSQDGTVQPPPVLEEGALLLQEKRRWWPFGSPPEGGGKFERG